MTRVVYPNSPLYARRLYWVAEALCRRDHNLRIRWSWERRKWVVEEKVKSRSVLFRPVRYVPAGIGREVREALEPELSDRYISWKDMYAPIYYIRKGALDGRIYHAMVLSDAGVFKSPVHYLNWLEAKEREEEKALEDKRREDRNAFHGEVYDYIKWKAGEKTFMRPGSGPVSDHNWW